MRALVLSGGGSKGSYQAGALKYILGELKIPYDIFCGVSVGAINCGFLAQFKTGEEVEGVTQLTKLWDEIDTPNIYQRWKPFGRLHALWEKSFYDSSPLHKLIKDKISIDRIRSSNKKINIGVTSLSSGKYTIFDQVHHSFIQAIIASASFPGMLGPVKIDGHWWADGGVKEITPIKTAIDLGATEIDIIMTSPEKRVKFFMEEPSTADIIQRVIDLASDKIMSNDIEKAIMYNRLAEVGYPDRKIIKINIIRPKNNLIEDLLDFNPIKIKEMMQRGYHDAAINYKI
jgi:NTE family protein